MVSCYLAALKTCTSPKLDLYTGGLLLAGIRFERERRRPVFGRVHSKVRLFSTKCYTTGGCQDLSIVDLAIAYFRDMVGDFYRLIT